MWLSLSLSLVKIVLYGHNTISFSHVPTDLHFQE